MILVFPLGPMIYRLVFQPVAEASVLVLLIVAVAVHLFMTGLALVFFGAEGWRTPPFMSGDVNIGPVTWSTQTFFVLGTCVALIIALWLFFGKTLYGRALRATAVNRRGARLVGISTSLSGTLTFTMAARSEEHTSELQSLMRISYAVFCLKKKKQKIDNRNHIISTSSNH